MINTVALIGRLTSDPELRHIPSGVPVTSFTIAVDRAYVKAGGEREADFINIEAWRHTAEFICEHFHKGQLIAVEGSLKTRLYRDKAGKKHKVFEVVANNVH